jgi:acid phosphatase
MMHCLAARDLVCMNHEEELNMKAFRRITASTQWRAAALLLAFGLLAGCATPAQRGPAAGHAVSAAANDNLNATLWMQASAEYHAAVSGSYALARQQLDAALVDPAWDALPPAERAAIARRGFESLPPAVIADADETLIDNSPFQARDILAKRSFESVKWLEWVSQSRARALPGAVEFAQYAASRGVTVYYVTNRDAPAELEATIANLRQVGFPVADDASNVLLRGDPRAPAREKGERRRWVGERHRVLLMLGDNLGDFLDGIKVSREQRQKLVDQHAGLWGRRWIMLPNPSYGSWEDAEMLACGQSALADPTACKRSRLRQD